MIQLEKLNGKKILVNPDLIRVVETTPDTILTFLDGQQLIVRDSPEGVAEKVIAFRKACFQYPAVNTQKG